MVKNLSNSEEAEPNEEGLKFYDNIFDECLKYGIEPLVTLHHFDMPYLLVEKYQGFLNRKVIDLYLKYVTTVFKRYKNKVKYWITFNEINFACIPMGNLEVLGIYHEKQKIIRILMMICKCAIKHYIMCF